jgi:hypothetical protein
LADLTSHRIEGIARMGNIPFSVPLLSQIDGNLWTGGCPASEAPTEFKYIVSLYPWGKYRVHDHQVYTETKLFDSHDGVDEERVILLAEYVNLCRARGMTLVHCQAGLNRSALVAATALILGGMAPAEAVKLLREKRSVVVLCNPAFEQWLMARAA